MRLAGKVVLVALALPALVSLLPAQGPVDEALDPFLYFALSLEATTERCELALLDESISVEVLLQRGTGDLAVSPEMRVGFIEGFRSKLSLAREICGSLERAGSYKLLGIRRVEGEPRALFRMISNSGLNYHDFLLAHGSGGGVQIIDFYNYLSGEWFSRTLRRSILPLVAEGNRSRPDRLSRGESAYVKNMPKIVRMEQQAAEGRFSEALAIFDEFPPELKQDKNVLMLRFKIAALAGGLAYKAALLDLKEQFPDDPAMEFTLIDHYFYARQFDKALEVIDSIDGKVDGDPYLDFFRANIYFTDGRFVEAKRAARRAIEREPDLQDPYWTLVTISLQERDYTETARLLGAIESDLGVAIGDLADLPEYSGFVESEDYRRWLERR